MWSDAGETERLPFGLGATVAGLSKGKVISGLSAGSMGSWRYPVESWN